MLKTNPKPKTPEYNNLGHKLMHWQITGQKEGNSLVYCFGHEIVNLEREGFTVVKF